MSKKLSEETKFKMSELTKGYTHTEESKEKIRQAKLGKKRPDMVGENNPVNKYNLNMVGENNPNWKGGFDKGKTYLLKYPEVQKYNGTVRRAKENSIPHSITLTEFRDWYYSTSKVCEYCEKDISIKTDKRMDNLSIDRKQNELGYISGNICFACNRCNTVKGNVFNHEEMKEIGQKYLKGK